MFVLCQMLQHKVTKLDKAENVTQTHKLILVLEQLPHTQ